MIFIVTLAFNPVKTMRASFKRVDETIGLRKEDYVRVFVDNHWPVDREDVLELLAEREAMGDIVLRPDKNLGLAGGFNYAFEQMKITVDDNIILVDPDNFPRTPRWGYAFKKVLEDKSVGWVSLWNHATKHETDAKPFHDKEINGYQVRVLEAPIMNSCCALAGHFIMTVGANEPNPFYGGFECGMWGHLKSMDLDWVFMREYFEDDITSVDKNFLDTNYQEYKRSTTHGGEKQIEYKEWLKLHGKI